MYETVCCLNHTNYYECACIIICFQHSNKRNIIYSCMVHILANRVPYDSSRIALYVCYYGCFHLEISAVDFHLKLHKPVVLTAYSTCIYLFLGSELTSNNIMSVWPFPSTDIILYI